MRVNHGRQRVVASTARSLAGGFKPFRDRSVAVSSVSCDTCGAAVGEQCVSATGNRAQHSV